MGQQLFFRKNEGGGLWTVYHGAQNTKKYYKPQKIIYTSEHTNIMQIKSMTLQLHKVSKNL